MTESERRRVHVTRRPAGRNAQILPAGEVGFLLVDEQGECAPSPAPATSPSGETRTTDPTTGAQKGSKLARYGLIPVGPLRELAEHFGKGCNKYAPRNWERGYDWELSFSALCRHAFAWWGGEDFDAHRPDCPEGCTEHTGSHHLTAVAWHSLVLREFCTTHPEKDTRPTTVAAKGAKP